MMLHDNVFLIDSYFSKYVNASFENEFNARSVDIKGVCEWSHLVYLDVYHFMYIQPTSSVLQMSIFLFCVCVWICWRSLMNVSTNFQRHVLHTYSGHPLAIFVKAQRFNFCPLVLGSFFFFIYIVNQIW